MKLLLTSGGVTNASIHAALEEMLGRPTAECRALCIPTAQHGHPWCTPGSAWNFVAGCSPAPMVDLGWASVGLLELLALPHRPREQWEAWVRAADVLLVDGGDAAFLTHWLRQTGLADLLPELRDTVWVGVSAGSMALTPRIGSQFVSWPGADGDDRGLGLVAFSIFPHLNYPDFPTNRMADAEAWAAQIGGPVYALDDQSALRVVDGAVQVISEGEWRAFP
ncbi:Type 1 glutamine amidotransferase-like domain-containing protein [Deinococcus xianganensis]|uniref:Type 1 glutamine amidotransferase-like domain-containing protein n=1 Tax=Deinococcus xianganensis TaxID=1507289 RepID=A0A6I4YE64_9DEIO|nr:Type 1 glutamine amidotransferase-like domain-containing protein [Deinococcus xianganensis]MXV18164.1 type 1 glutamine amidotransferase-like domain-containing protein [Deinococcus xianganensis]